MVRIQYGGVEFNALLDQIPVANMTSSDFILRATNENIAGLMLDPNFISAQSVICTEDQLDGWSFGEPVPPSPTFRQMLSREHGDAQLNIHYSTQEKVLYCNKY